MPDENEERRQEAAHQEELERREQKIKEELEELEEKVSKLMTAAEAEALGRSPSIDAKDMGDTLRRMAGVAGVMPSSDFDLLDDWFEYHSPKGDQPSRYSDLRGRGFYMARAILKHCPPCQERALAIRKVREAVMWANAAIACNE